MRIGEGYALRRPAPPDRPSAPARAHRRGKTDGTPHRAQRLNGSRALISPTRAERLAPRRECAREGENAIHAKFTPFYAMREGRHRAQITQDRPQCPQNAPQGTDGTQGAPIHQERHKSPYSANIKLTGAHSPSAVAPSTASPIRIRSAFRNYPRLLYLSFISLAIIYFFTFFVTFFLFFADPAPFSHFLRTQRPPGCTFFLHDIKKI